MNGRVKAPESADAAARERKPYHHGNLRTAIIAAALEALRTRAPADISLRDLARGAGVGHSSLYTHFRDRDALLAMIAGEGLVALSHALAAAVKAAPNDPIGALATAYLRFARSFPEYYRVMFRPENVQPDNLPLVEEASDRCFVLLVEAVRGSSMPEAEARDRSVGIWSMLHGLVVLGENDGPLQQKVAPDREPVLGARMARLLASGDISAGDAVLQETPLSAVADPQR